LAAMARGSSSPRGGSAGGGPARERRSSSPQAAADSSSSRVAAARDRLVRGVLSPVNAVLLTRRHIEEVVEDAVLRGRMTRSDAQEMIQSLLSRSARATDDFLSDLERMLGGGGDSLGPPAERRSLPIAGYDQLSAAQVQEQLDGLAPAELRRLRDYEARHANRKTVLDRIERKLR
jgi:hypothetical protein